jgi:GTPase
VVPDPLGDYEAINQELELFNPALRAKPQIVALNKMDLPDVRAIWPKLERALKERNVEEPLIVSAATGENLDALLHRAAEMLAELPLPPRAADQVPVTPFVTPDDDAQFTIERAGDGTWRVRGRRIERIVAMTRWDYYDSLLRFQRILDALGISQALRDKGVKDNDAVQIGDVELEWREENAF